MDSTVHRNQIGRNINQDINTLTTINNPTQMETQNQNNKEEQQDDNNNNNNSNNNNLNSNNIELNELIIENNNNNNNINVHKEEQNKIISYNFQQNFKNISYQENSKRDNLTSTSTINKQLMNMRLSRSGSSQKIKSQSRIRKDDSRTTVTAINSKYNNDYDKLKTLENLISEIKYDGFEKISNQIKENKNIKLTLESNINEMEAKLLNMKEEIKALNNANREKSVIIHSCTFKDDVNYLNNF